MCVESSEIRLGRGKIYLVTQSCMKTNQQVNQFTFGNTLGVETSHGQHGFTGLITTWVQEKPPPSPIQYSLCYSAVPTFKWHFFPRLLRRNAEIVLVWTPKNLSAHIFQFKPPIAMKSQANLQLSSRAFQRCVALYLHAPGSSRFPTFSGRESKCQFDSQPFFCP